MTEYDHIAGGISTIGSRIAHFLRWWDAHRAWPATESVRIVER